MKNNKYVEEKFFKLHVLGILANRKDFEKEYNIKLSDKQSIKNEFIQLENISEEEFDNYHIKYQHISKKIRDLATSQRCEEFGGRIAFLKWYLKEKKQCCYCGIEEKQLEKYFNDANIQYKHARQRGRRLEIERIYTAPPEKNKYTPDNVALACYICNNAKSDFISPQNFKPIAKGINQFWREQNIEIIDFENIKFWDKIKYYNV